MRAIAAHVQEEEKLIRRMLLLYVLSISVAAFAQSVPAAEGQNGSIWVGAEFSTFNPDYGCVSNSPVSCWNNQLQGIAVFGDANRLLGKIGVETEGRWLNWGAENSTITESNYLAGPRVQVFAKSRFSFNVKVLGGGARFTKNSATTGTFAAAFGGTAGYRFSPRLMARAEYEYQAWPGFGSSGLTPNGFSFGVSYRIMR